MFRSVSNQGMVEQENANETDDSKRCYRRYTVRRAAEIDLRLSQHAVFFPLEVFDLTSRAL